MTSFESQVGADINKIRSKMVHRFSNGDTNDGILENDELGELFLPPRKVDFGNLASRKLISLNALELFHSHINALRFSTLNHGIPVTSLEENDFCFEYMRDPSDIMYLKRINMGTHQTLVDTEEAIYSETLNAIYLGIITPSPIPNIRLQTIFDFEGTFELMVLMDDLSEEGPVSLGTPKMPVSRITTKEHRLVNYSFQSFFRQLQSDSRSMISR